MQIMPNDPPIVDVIASGVHDAKNVLFDALMRVGVAMREVSADRGEAALPLLLEVESAIEDAADRLSTLLSAYRLSSHENPVVLMPVAVSDLLDDALLRAHQLGSHRDGVTIDRGTVCGDTVLLDRELVADSLVNAIQNAGRYAQSRVLVSAMAEGDWLTFRVEDDGPGLDTMDENATDEAGHSGVGLFVARRIAALHSRHGRRGNLTLMNGGVLGGALFEMVLPT